MTRPKRRDERYQIRLSSAERRALEKLAIERDVPASQIVRQALRTALQEAAQAGR